MEKRIIIGLVGQIASGKGFATKYLEGMYKASSFRFSTILRDIINRLYQEINRANMQELSTLLRQKFGEDILAKTIVEDIKKCDNKIIVVEGIRRLADFENLKKINGFKLVGISAKSETRYQRLVARKENSDDNEKTYEQFVKEQENEADAEIPDVMTNVEIILNNDGNIEDLYKQIDDLIKTS
ncbi:MAG: AAA family ATPase [bacterium]